MNDPLTDFEREVDKALTAIIVQSSQASYPEITISMDALARRVAAAIEAAAEASLYESKPDAGRHAGLMALRGHSSGPEGETP